MSTAPSNSTISSGIRYRYRNGNTEGASSSGDADSADDDSYIGRGPELRTSDSNLNLAEMSAQHKLLRKLRSNFSTTSPSTNEGDASSAQGPPALFKLGADVIQQGMNAVVDDSFTRCFAQNPPEPWNWTWYLAPAWALGVLVRYCVLFPLRFMVLVTGWCITVVSLALVRACRPILPKSTFRYAQAK